MNGFEYDLSMLIILVLQVGILINDKFLVVYKIAVCKIKSVTVTSLYLSTVKQEKKAESFKERLFTLL